MQELRKEEEKVPAPRDATNGLEVRRILAGKRRRRNGDNFMWSYEAADEADHLLLERQATFDPTKACIEAVPACSVAPIALICGTVGL